MTTFDQLESSEQSSEPAELYIFAIGAETFEFTSSEDDITVSGTKYLSEPGLKRTATQQGKDARNTPITINLPASNPFAAKWKIRPPGLSGSVTVLRVQRSELPAIGTTSALEFKGIVRGVGYPKSGLEAIMEVSSIETAGNRPVPRYRFSIGCGHFLYGPGCKVDPDLHKVTAVVTTEAGNTITVPGVGAFADGTFTSGYVKPAGVSDFRLILAQVGDLLTLDLPFKEAVLSTSVDAFKGCDHIIDQDCDLIFDNVIEFGGHAFVPKRKIFEVGLL